MATTAIVSKGDLFELMGMEAFKFAVWMNGADAMLWLWRQRQYLHHYKKLI